MSSSHYKIVYCSRNRIHGTAEEVKAEIKTILASSRKNNSALQVTGALIYNDGNFAQVLEGPLKAVELTFERIQCDPRHSEVTVVESGMADSRNFPDWSMAFAGNTVEQSAEVKRAFSAVFSNAAGSGTQMLGVLQKLVVQQDDWILADA